MPLMPLASPLGGGGGSGPVITVLPALPSPVRFSAVGSAADFGTDVEALPDLDDTLTPRAGVHVVLDALARRFITPRGKLWAHPDYGRDLRQYLNGVVTTLTLGRLKSDVEEQALQDERISTARASVSYDQGTRRLAISLKVATSSGPFTLTLGVSQLTVELLTGTVSP